MLSLERLSVAPNPPLVTPLAKDATGEVLRCSETCQGCSLRYAADDVMVIDDVGPMCFNCCYHCTRDVMVKDGDRQAKNRRARKLRAELATHDARSRSV